MNERRQSAVDEIDVAVAEAIQACGDRGTDQGAVADGSGA